MDESDRAYRERKEEARRQGSPYCFTIPEFSRRIRQIVLETLNELECQAIREPGVFLDQAIRKIWKEYAPSSTQKTMSDLMVVWELLTGLRMKCRHSQQVLRAANRKSQSTPKKKAAVWTLERALEEGKKAPRGTRKLFLMALALAARSGDLEDAVHVSADTAGWRVGLPFQKTRGTTGQVMARVPRSWCRAVGVWDHVRTLEPGQQLATSSAVLALRKHMKGKLHVFRRSAISLRVRMGHSPMNIRQATMHTSDKVMHTYVGIPELLGKASATSRRR